MGRSSRVVGYDGTRLAGIRPLSLTTVGQPLEELAEPDPCNRVPHESGYPEQTS